MSLSNAYRRVLKASLMAFKGDSQAKQKFRQEFRAECQKYKTAEKKLAFAEGVTSLLEHNVAKATLNYQTNRLELRIDSSRHQLGDNNDRFCKK
ncbi:hypothetical protein MIR68_000032 [Amoeboaphelidium protococcarum]|nr:hypothetical protein MIR68_000032 [Amoeboaphelidium protococcarum]